MPYENLLEAELMRVNEEVNNEPTRIPQPIGDGKTNIGAPYTEGSNEIERPKLVMHQVELDHNGHPKLVR